MYLGKQTGQSKYSQAGRYGKAGREERCIETADGWFSWFIRLRDIVKVISPIEAYCRCVTCGKLIHLYKRFTEDTRAAEAGHYMKREKPMTRYKEKNVHAQCKECNHYHGGEEALYGLAIDKKYGKGTAETLIHLSRIRGQRNYGGIALADISEKYRIKAYTMADHKKIDLKTILKRVK